MNSVRSISGPPSASSIYSVTSLGEVLVFDPKVAEDGGCDSEAKKCDGQYSQQIPLDGKSMPLAHTLENGFVAGCVLAFSLRMAEDSQG